MNIQNFNPETHKDDYINEVSRLDELNKGVSSNLSTEELKNLLTEREEIERNLQNQIDLAHEHALTENNKFNSYVTAIDALTYSINDMLSKVKNLKYDVNKISGNEAAVEDLVIADNNKVQSLETKINEQQKEKQIKERDFFRAIVSKELEGSKIVNYIPIQLDIEEKPGRFDYGIAEADKNKTIRQRSCALLKIEGSDTAMLIADDARQIGSTSFFVSRKVAGRPYTPPGVLEQYKEQNIRDSKVENELDHRQNLNGGYLFCGCGCMDTCSVYDKEKKNFTDEFIQTVQEEAKKHGVGKILIRHPGESGFIEVKDSIEDKTLGRELGVNRFVFNGSDDSERVAIYYSTY